MAKPLGPKSALIREAIQNNRELGNTEIAALINGSADRKGDKIAVKPQDIAQQRQAMKKAGIAVGGRKAAGGKAAAKGNGRRGGRKKTAPAAAQPAPSAQGGAVDLIDKTLDLAQRCGGVGELKKLVDRLADMQRW